MQRILLVEDDPALGESVKIHLETENFFVEWASTLNEATEKWKANSEFSLLILDLSLPDGSGLKFCATIRKERASFPILILSAQVDEDSVVAGFAAGANDYVKKPFSNKELLARIRAWTKTAAPLESGLHFGDLKLQADQRSLMVQGKSVPLNRREFELIHLLISRPGSVVTRDAILNRLTGEEEMLDRTVDSHISHLRAKLKEAKSSVAVKTEYGVGYRLVTND